MKGKVTLVLFVIIFFSLESSRDSLSAENQTKPEKTIVFSTVTPRSLSVFNQLSLVYTEAFKRLGYHFKLVDLPGERSLVDADSGVVDGEACRIAYLDANKYPNLIRVTEPILSDTEGAYSVDTSIMINGWESLRGKGYKVGLFKGVKSIEKKLPLYVDKRDIVTVTGFEQMLKMLQARRIDIYLGSTFIEESVPMRSDAYKDIKRVGIVEVKMLYPWFHKRHEALVAPLADVLKKMKSEGTYTRLIQEASQQ